MSTAQRSAFVVPDALAKASSFTRPAKTAPIPLPSRARVEEICRTRANGDNERWRRQVEQRAELIAAARAEGYNAGERTGYTQGWHWGCACGAAVGGVAIGLLWAAWGPLRALLAALGLA